MLYVFENLIKTTIVCSLGICLLLFLKRYLFKKFSKRFNYYIWLIVVFRMLLFLFNYTIVYEVKESKENTVGNNITQIDISTDNNLMLYVAYLWLFVTIVIAVYTFIKYTRFKNLVVDVSYDIEEYTIYDLEIIYHQAKIYYIFGYYDNALNTNKKLLEKSKNAKNYNYVKLAYKNIYLCFEKIQNYEMSMKYFKMYYELKMMYIKARNRNYIDSLNYRHEYIEKEINNMRKVKLDLDKKKYIDHLTSAYNRTFLNDFLEKQEVSEYCTAFMIDVDYFKEYNDTYGHYNGDIALKDITIIIKKYLKKDMLMIRYGGEEFLILSVCKDYKKSKIFGRKLCRIVKKFLNNNLTVSIGIDTCKNSSIDIREIIENADKALYKAKESGRNRCLHYHDFKNF